MKAMGDKLFKDITKLTHNTAIITNALADTQDALKDNEKKIKSELSNYLKQLNTLRLNLANPKSSSSQTI